LCSRAAVFNREKLFLNLAAVLLVYLRGDSSLAFAGSNDTLFSLSFRTKLGISFLILKSFSLFKTTALLLYLMTEKEMQKKSIN
jgi:hypothetical protein